MKEISKQQYMFEIEKPFFIKLNPFYEVIYNDISHVSVYKSSLLRKKLYIEATINNEIPYKLGIEDNNLLITINKSSNNENGEFNQNTYLSKFFTKKHKFISQSKTDPANILKYLTDLKLNIYAIDIKKLPERRSYGFYDRNASIFNINKYRIKIYSAPLSEGIIDFFFSNKCDILNKNEIRYIKVNEYYIFDEVIINAYKKLEPYFEEVHALKNSIKSLDRERVVVDGESIVHHYAGISLIFMLKMGVDPQLLI